MGKSILACSIRMDYPGLYTCCLSRSLPHTCPLFSPSTLWREALGLVINNNKSQHLLSLNYTLSASHTYLLIIKTFLKYECFQCVRSLWLIEIKQNQEITQIIKAAKPESKSDLLTSKHETFLPCKLFHREYLLSLRTFPPAIFSVMTQNIGFEVRLGLFFAFRTCLAVQS